MSGSGITVSAATTLERFLFSQDGIRLLLKGPVVQDLVKRAIRVEASAKTYATGTGGGPQVRTGRLRSSIGWQIGNDAVSPYVDVGSGVLYAPYVELGTSRMPAYPYLRPALEAARTT